MARSIILSAILRLKRNNVSFLILVVSCVCTLMPAWATGAASREVRVGLFSLEPVVFQDQNGTGAGIYSDILAEIGRQENWEIVYIPGSWNDGLQRLETGEVDLVTSIAYSPARDQKYDYSQEAVLNIWGEVYIAPNTEVQSLLDLKGAKVAVMKGDINGQNFKRLAASFELQCSYMELASHHEVLGVVKDGDVVAGVVPNVYGTYHAPTMGLVKTSIVFDAFSVYFAAAEGKNQHILSTIDTYLNKWKTDRQSPYHRILEYWLSGGHAQALLPTWLIWLLVIVGTASLLFALWVRVLKVQVAARTRDLLESEERYRGIFNSTTDAIFIHEVDTGAILDVSDSVQEMFGYSRAEVKQISVESLSLGEPPYSGQEAGNFIRAAEQGEPQLFNWRSRRKDGSLFWSEVGLRGFSIGDDRLVSAVVRDVSDRKKLEEQVMQSQRMEAMGTLAGGIAHDFNNILGAIIGYAELAELGLEDKEQAQEDIGQVLKAANRAKELVRQILTFARKRQDKKQPIQISLIVKEALKLLRSSIPTTIDIQQDLKSQSYVEAEPTQIHQVVMNLCTNAYHAMEEKGGVLYVALQDVEMDREIKGKKCNLPAGSYLRLAVSDTGEGMDESTQARIFEPYFTTKGVDKGTGLGLAVVHGIVESHRGGIYLYSEPENGTTFHVYFPVCRVGEVVEPDNARVPPAHGTERVMVVDDEQALRSYCQAALEQYGYKVVAFAHPKEALAEFEQHPDSYQLIITDMTMPGCTGLELINKIKQKRPQIPTIICSGFSEKLRQLNQKEQPFDAYCEKPLSTSELLATTRRVLDGK